MSEEQIYKTGALDIEIRRVGTESSFYQVFQEETFTTVPEIVEVNFQPSK